MTPHSPTPWRFLEADNHEDEGYRFHSLTICDADNNDLANLYDRDHCNGPRTTREQNVANAHLMAAAPEMLELLIQSRVYSGTEWSKRRDALIAKAQGR